MCAHRRGFTLIEALVVGGIATTVLALFVPALQDAREIARTTQCKENLKLLGMAFESYHAVHKQLPPAYTLGIANGEIADFNMHGWGEFILPYINQVKVYDRIDFKEPFFAPEDMTSLRKPNYKADNETVLKTTIETFLCPSSKRSADAYDATRPAGRTFPKAITFSTGAADYAPCAGVFRGLYEAVQARGHQETLPYGVLTARHANFRLDDVTDGRSQTLILGELGGRNDLYKFGAQVPDGANSGGGWADFGNLENWLHGSKPDGSVDNQGGPCVINCNNAAGHGFYGFHPGGVHVLLCDGAVRFINEKLSIVTFCQLATPQGGSEIKDDF